MNHPPARIMVAVLTDPSGSYFTLPESNLAWPLFTSALPDTEGIPNNAAACYDTTGRMVARKLASGGEEQIFGIQIKGRSLDYASVFSRLTKVAESFESIKRMSVTLDGTTYTVDSIWRTSPVISMGQDEKRRALCSVNVMLALIGY